jgi:hypothetical protein
VDVRVECPDVMITRPGPWGNPWRPKKSRYLGWGAHHKTIGFFIPSVPDDTKAAALKICLAAYEQDVRENDALMDRLPELRGKRLGCYCRAGDPCHGDVLVRLVEEFCGDNA